MSHGVNQAFRRTAGCEIAEACGQMRLYKLGRLH